MDDSIRVPRRPFLLRFRDRTLELGRCTRLMGIVNLTPDSFSDGGRFVSPASAVEHCLRLVEEGADMLDLGGESSRPGSRPISEAEEIGRVLPVLEAIRPRTEIPISVDTWKSGVAAAAIEAGADLINDISGLRFDTRLGEIVASSGVGLVLMHMRGNPATMQQLPPSSDILNDVVSTLQTVLEQAYKTGIARDRILLDPGIGFGKTLRDNLVLLNRLPRLVELEQPVLVGPSRKSFLGSILNRPVGDRVWGTAGACAVCILRGAHVLRVHDVGEIRQVADVVDAILAESFKA